MNFDKLNKFNKGGFEFFFFNFKIKEITLCIFLKEWKQVLTDPIRAMMDLIYQQV